MGLYIKASSAYNLTVLLMSLGKSLIYKRKRSGPRTEPWGTPESTGQESLWRLFRITAEFFLTKKSLIQPSMDG